LCVPTLSTLPLYQVDAFTDRPFAGNPAAVCPLAEAIPEALMQDIAAENNLSETAFFLTAPQGDAHSLRWFTPTVEVDLCGHATLASAFVLMTELEPTRTEVTFRTRSGLLPVRRRGDELVLDFPARPPVPADAATRATVAAALGAEPLEVLRVPNGTLLAVLPDAAAVRNAAPDLAAVARTGASLALTAPGAGEARPVDFVSRYFAPAHGVPEDPVTGSSLCFLGPYWAARLDKPELRARQVSRRGGELTCTLAGDRVHIGGKARLVITGTLRY
jgi:PhzF family phenazine biosynthesis protein